MSYTLYHGDCFDHLRSLASQSVDAIITDPPYSSGGQYRGDRLHGVHEKYTQHGCKTAYRPEFAGDNRDQRGWAYWSTLWLSACLRIAKDGAPICLFADWRQLPTATDVLQAGGWLWRGVAVWDKTGAARPCKGRFTAQCEYIIWGSKGRMPIDRGVGVLPGVFRHVVRQADKYHTTGKPTPLMLDVVRICTDGGVILDPFMGSGTTGVAARNTGRRFIGIEQDAAYYAIAEQRIAAAAAPEPVV